MRRRKGWPPKKVPFKAFFADPIYGSIIELQIVGILITEHGGSTYFDSKDKMRTAGWDEHQLSWDAEEATRRWRAK